MNFDEFVFQSGVDGSDGLDDDGLLILVEGIAAINEVKQEVGLPDFLETRLESVEELVGEVGDEADRVLQQSLLAGGQVDLPLDGLESLEEHVFGEDDFPVEQSVHQVALAGVGVADDRHLAHGLAVFETQSLLAQKLLVLLQSRKLLPDLLLLVLDHSPLQLHLVLAAPSQRPSDVPLFGRHHLVLYLASKHQISFENVVLS